MNRTPLIFLNVLIIATCGLIYELLAGTLASYVLGDSVTQFSIIIGLYLFAMGVGSWLSRYIEKNVARKFVEIELGVAVIGGFSAPLLFLSFAYVSYFYVILYLIVFIIGALVGLEIPLLMRILKDHLDFKELVSRVLAFDYIGALVASLLFPIFLVPRLGLVRTSLLFGLLNAGVGLWGTWLMQPLIKGRVTGLRVRAGVVITLLIIGFIKANSFTTLAEDGLFSDDIIYAKQSAYQRIVVTRNRAGFQLFLNGNLQFSSVDEYRYHEALVHPAMMVAGNQPKRVLILGGGDGLGLREVLKYKSVEHITLVDLDPDMTELSKRLPILAELNKRAFDDPRVTVINEDAMIWLEKEVPPFDVAIVDFPDPNTFALGKLYTTRFYKMLQARLAPEAAVAIQSTSPLFARQSYWCIIRTLEAAGFYVKPYQTSVPAFGIWGYALARRARFELPNKVPEGVELKFLDNQSIAGFFILSADIGPVAVEINRLDNQALVRYYENEWRKFE